MRQQRSTRTRRLAAAAVVAAIVLGACSGDDDDSSSSTIGGTQPEETASVDTEPAETAAPDTEVPDTEAPPTGEPFVFGYLRPPTGIQSTLALAQETAMQLALDDINAAGGVNGAPAELLVVDEPGDGDTAAAVTELVDGGAAMVLGPVSSTTALAALPALGTAGSVACSASATAPDLTSVDTENVLYRTAMPDTYTMAYVAEQIAADQAAASLPEGQPYKVSILARQDDYGIGVGNGLAAALTARGMEVQVVPYTPRRVIFTEEASQIAGFAPNSVVLVSYGEAVRQVSALVSAGVAASSIIGLDGAFNPSLATGAFPNDPSQADGLRVIGSTGDRAFIDRLLSAESTLTQLIFGAQMYDCVMVGALAAQQAGSNDTAAFAPQIGPVTNEGQSCSTVDDCFSKIAAGEEIDYEGVSGGIRFDEAGDPTEVRVTVAQFTGGDLTEVRSDDLNLDNLRQQEALAAAIFTTQVQQLLTILGFYTGPIDGQESDELTASIALFQQHLGVPVTGVWDAETDAAAREKYGNLLTGLSGSVIGIQQLLTDLGYYTGPIDGVLSQATVDAIKAFQADLGVPQTGVIDAATLVAAFQAGITVGTPTTTVPPATTAPPETTTPPETTAPPPATTTTVPPPVTVPPTTAPIDPPEPTDPTILEALRADPRFSEFVGLIEAAGFPADFGQTIGTITVFAPTNDALAAVDPAVLDQLRNDQALLQWYLSYTVVQGNVTLESLATIDAVQSLLGEFIPVSVVNGVVQVDGVDTIPPRIAALNGGIIPVAGVLIPEATPPA